MRSVFSFLLSLSWLAYFSLLALFVVGSLLANPELKLFGRFQTFITQSGSMVPTIQVGDLIFVDITKDKEPTSGQIVTFKDAEGQTVTHRVIKTFPKDGQVFFTTKGDNNNAPDPEPLTKEQIIGFYKARLPFFVYFLVYLRKPAGLLLLILVPIALTAFGELLKPIASRSLKSKVQPDSSPKTEVEARTLSRKIDRPQDKPKIVIEDI